MYRNCVCYSNDRTDSGVSVFGEHYNLVTVTNDMNVPVEVMWMGVGWHCSTTWYKFTPFICHHRVLAPGESYTYNIKGYANTVGFQDPFDPRRSCGGPDMFSEGKHSLRTSKYLRAGSRSCTTLFGLACDLIAAATNIPVIGSAIKALVKTIPGFNCAFPPDLLEEPEPVRPPTFRPELEMPPTLRPGAGQEMPPTLRPGLEDMMPPF